MRIGSSNNVYFVNPALNDWQRVMQMCAPQGIPHMPFPYLARQLGLYWVVWVFLLADGAAASWVSMSHLTFFMLRNSGFSQNPKII